MIPANLRHFADMKKFFDDYLRYQRHDFFKSRHDFCKSRHDVRNSPSSFSCDTIISKFWSQDEVFLFPSLARGSERDTETCEQTTKQKTVFL